MRRTIAQWFVQAVGNVETSVTSRIGGRAERAAERHLKRRGLELLDRNYRTRRGEIDLIMRDGNVVVFVEVRFRSRSDFVAPEETIGPHKRARISAAAGQYLASTRSGTQACRFDVVSVTRPNYRLVCRWIKDAFAS